MFKSLLFFYVAGCSTTIKHLLRRTLVQLATYFSKNVSFYFQET